MQRNMTIRKFRLSFGKGILIGLILNACASKVDDTVPAKNYSANNLSRCTEPKLKMRHCYWREHHVAMLLCCLGFVNIPLKLKS